MYTKKTYPGLVIIILITLWIAILPDIGSALTARSHIGPGLAYYSGRETWTFLLFKGHNNDYIWEGRYKGGVWEGLGQVHDQDSTSWAFTDHEPVAFTYHLHAIETGVMPRTSRWWLYLVFNGHNNDYVWYTRKEIHEAYASVYMGDWETPRLIPGTDTDLSPGAAMHDWGAGDEVLTIGYTGDDGRIHIKRAAYDFYHQTPYEWQSVTSLPSTAKSSDGPALISYNGKLYVFYRGTGTNYKIYYAVARNNNPTNPDWEISQIPYAYSTHTPSVTEYKGDLIVTFKGHNNQYIWIRRYDNETGEWQNMGYVKDLKTDQRPDIESTGNWLTLAFRAPNYANTNLCVGSLILDENLRGDKPGHTWYKTTGDLCCPEDGLAVYDLLIITPGEFTAALQPLVDHKNATNCPTLMVNLDSIYSNSTFSGDDEPEKIKRAIEFYEKYFGIKYVMLVGDCTRFPVRWQLGHFVDRLIEDSDPDNNDRVYLPSDFYYADLYYGDRNFNDWDADNDRYYGEIYADDLNPDNIDPIPDVGLARVPATNSAQLETYVAKVIRYEYSPLIKKILMIQKGWSTHIGTKENIAAFLAPLGIDTIRLYEDIDPSDYPGTPDDIPTANNISSRLNNRVGFVSHLYHSSPQNWNYLYSISNIRNNLHNSSALPVIYSNGCQTAQFFKATIPYCPYLGVDGLEHGGGVSVGDVGDTVYIRPAVIQPDSYNILSISEAFLLENDNGAIAYYGCSETGEPTYHKYLEEFFFKAYSLGETILGDMWMYSVREFADFYDLKNLVADNSWGRTCKMHTPSRFILFGDPSVRVGGVGNLTDTIAPVTMIDMSGWPDIYLNALDYGSPPSGVRRINYRIDGSDWRTGNHFTISYGSHTIEYYSEDFLGNVEQSQAKSVLPMAMALPAGWSLISLPVIPQNGSLSELFPEAVVVYGYERNSGYVRVTENEEMQPATGYWILLQDAKTYTLFGETIQFYSQWIPLSGWYLKGGCSFPARASISSGNIDVIYGYKQGAGYQRVSVSETIDPCNGYWILLSGIDFTNQAQLNVGRVAP